MTRRHFFPLLITLIGCYYVATADQPCQVVPKCSCVFGNKTVDIEPNVQGSEALAGAVGALSSLLTCSGAFAIWYYCKKKKGAESYSRSSSNMSRDSISKGREPPPYSTDYPRRDMPDTGRKPPGMNANVYRAGVNDNINMRVGSRMSSSYSHYRGSGSDWN